MATIYKAATSNLIALCYIIDEFEVFNKRLVDALSSKYNKDFAYNLWNVSKGQFCLCSRKVRRFYKDNKLIIDTINEYSNISMFIIDNYDYQGNLVNNESLSYFYKYILNHKEKLCDIIDLLTRLRILGFDKLKFNPDLDFSKIEYRYRCDNILGEFTYLDNLVTIPSYDKDVVAYISNGSNYKMDFSILNERIQNKEIILNDLTFSPTRLPNSISMADINSKISDLRSQGKQECSYVRDSVNLMTCIDYINMMFDDADKKINNLETVDKKTELVELLTRARETILQMQSISDEYNKILSDSNEHITEDVLTKEKILYQTKIRNSNIHI